MEAHWSTGDDAVRPASTSTKAGKFVLEIARDHVANFTDRVPHLSFRRDSLGAQHADSNLFGGLRSATEGHRSAKRSARATMAVMPSRCRGSDFVVRVSWVPSMILEHFLRREFENRQPLMLARKSHDGRVRTHGFFSRTGKKPCLHLIQENGLRMYPRAPAERACTT